MKKILFVVFLSTLFSFLTTQESNAQNHAHQFNHQDTLRGSITAERAWWDLRHYELSITVDPTTKTIAGSNEIEYKVLSTFPNQRMQIDLQAPLKITNITQNNTPLTYKKDGNAYFIQVPNSLKIGDTYKIKIEYKGTPRPAARAPWDGGFSWSIDANGKPFIATSCQGLGASIWWPCKDHMYDEPEKGITIHATVPKDLIAVSNGRLINASKSKTSKNLKTYTWNVQNPINNYGVNINIGDYTHFSEKIDGEKGKLDMDYWVLKDNLKKAKLQFQDAPRMIKAFEHWFGPYPFYEDGYKLVEVPYLGMEHQSSTTYGNGYKNGYLGTDRSQTGWGLKFDFIIIHESGHEWFANNITYKDQADMWIHESFTNYSESLFLEYHYGKEAAWEYIRGLRMAIQNKEPMISPYGVNSNAPGDIYNKGSNMLHTIRQLANDDKKWRTMLRGLNETFYHQTVNTRQIEEYMATSLGINLNLFFDQYLRDKRIPVFEYRIKDDHTLIYRWSNCIDGFNMPLKIKIDGQVHQLYFQSGRPFSTLELSSEIKNVQVDPNFYVYSLNLMGK